MTWPFVPVQAGMCRLPRVTSCCISTTKPASLTLTQCATVAFGDAVPNSILFLGRPGVGKTTVIREMARVLADELHKRVVIVDTSNEIGGDGDVPHPAIGGARRMQVPDPSQQHKVMVKTLLPLFHSPSA